MTASPPTEPKAIVFVDGQNLYHAVKDAFGYPYPNYDVGRLAELICQDEGWTLSQVRFYTGIPSRQADPFWNHFWTHKLSHMGYRGIFVYSRQLRYSNQVVHLPDGRVQTTLVAREKGIDVRLALDVVSLAWNRHYDVAIIFSQDQDLTEAVEEVKLITRQQNRWIRLACAFPTSPTARNRRGIDKTDWIPIDKAIYDTCVDTRDYRPKSSGRRPSSS